MIQAWPYRRHSSKVSPLTVRFADDLDTRRVRSAAPSPSPTLMARQPAIRGGVPRGKAAAAPAKKPSPAPPPPAKKPGPAPARKQPGRPILKKPQPPPLPPAPPSPDPSTSTVTSDTYDPAGSGTDPSGSGTDPSSVSVSGTDPSSSSSDEPSDLDLATAAPLPADWTAALRRTFGSIDSTDAAPADLKRRRHSRKDLRAYLRRLSNAPTSPSHAEPLLLFVLWTLVGVVAVALAILHLRAQPSAVAGLARRGVEGVAGNVAGALVAGWNGVRLVATVAWRVWTAPVGVLLWAVEGQRVVRGLPPMK